MKTTTHPQQAQHDELIATFMGFKEFQGALLPPEKDIQLYDWENCTERYKPDFLRFNRSWDWLLPVVAKIVDLTEKEEIYNEKWSYLTVDHSDFLIGLLSNDHEPVLRCVVVFLQWLKIHPTYDVSLLELMQEYDQGESANDTIYL